MSSKPDSTDEIRTRIKPTLDEVAGILENKPRTPVPRSPTTKATAFCPRLPCISPQIRHKNTTVYDPFLPKSPVKHHKPTTRKNLDLSTPKCAERVDSHWLSIKEL
jgi:hypothetical protein